MKNLLRRSKLIAQGILTFKDWDVWLAKRLHILKRKGVGTFRLRNGVVFNFDFSRDDVGIFQEIWLKDVYQKFHKVSPGEVVIDIGAHIGSFSVLAASKGAAVYAYEPTPQTFALLRKNATGYAIHPFNLAVADSAREIKIFEVVEGSSGNSAIPNAAFDQASFFIAKTTTLVDIFADNHIVRCDLLKMDCEGAETGILQAAPAEIFQKVKDIAMEYHGNLAEVSQILKDKGCRIREIDGNESIGFLYANGSAGLP